jgi:outer membrane protein
MLKTLKIKPLICVPAILLMLGRSAEVARADPPDAEHALWEAGIVGAVSYVPDYPAASHSRLKWVAAPYGVYRGKIVRADREGARARFLHGDAYDVDLGLAASFASRSKDNPEREGMPDLDYLLELGPRFSLSLARLAGSGKLMFFLPVRAVFSTDLSNFHHQGYTLSPALHARWPINRRGWMAYTQLTGNFGSRGVCAYYYDVPAEFSRPGRQTYDARAGYIGSDLIGGVLVPLGRRVHLFTGAQTLLHTGSANEQSPLYRHPFNYSLSAGLIWNFYRSAKSAVVAD